MAVTAPCDNLFVAGATGPPVQRGPTVARILLIDDQEMVRDFLAAALTCHGHDVTSAPSCLIADGAAPDTNPAFDLVIADDIRPETEAFELIRALKSARPQTKLIAISGGGRYGEAADDLTLAFDAGANATLSKPFSTADLFRTVERTLVRS
jgi:DNA-binding response OmpR family regulator